MIKIQNAKEDIVPITAFRTQLSAILERIKTRKDPVILTHNGRATAVVLDIEVYEELMQDLEITSRAMVDLTAITKGEHPSFEGVKHKKSGARK